MKLGMIVRMDNTGLGIQTWEAYRHLKPAKTLAIDYSSFKDYKQYPERYPGAQIVRGIPNPVEVKQFLDGLDVVFTCETPYAFSLLETAKFMGIKTVVQPNYEFFRWIKYPKFPQPDLFALPSLWHVEDIPFENKQFLPVPIAMDRFKDMRDKPDTAKNFLHIVGKPAANNRNGTDILLRSLQFVKSDINLTIRCFKKGYVEELMKGIMVPSNVKVTLDDSFIDDYWEAYRGFDALIMPRRYGGLCLPINEALGAGMPVIAPNIDPQSRWLPKDWLVDAKESGTFESNTTFMMYDAYPRPLARRIDRMAEDRDFYRGCVYATHFLANQISWEMLETNYMVMFEDLVQSNKKG